ncbi:MAG: hypothetical protein ACYCS1_04360 [Gammaproteobacteria bacterium]
MLLIFLSILGGLAGISGALNNFFNFIANMFYAIIIFFIVLIYEMLLRFDVTSTWNAVAKAINTYALKDRSLLPTVQNQQTNRTIQAQLFKFDSVFKILINVNRGLLYGVLFMAVIQGIDPSIGIGAIFIENISGIIAFEAFGVLPIMFSLVLFDKLSDIIGLVFDVAR